MSNLITKIGNKVVDYILNDKYGDGSELTQKNLEAFLRESRVSELLLYRYYYEKDGIGIYTDCMGRKGFIFEVNAPVFMNESVELMLMALLESININGTVVQFITFASQNVNREIEDFIANHPCEVNVDNRKILREIIKKRADYIKKWSTHNIYKNINYRIKNYKNLICVLYPKDIDEQDIRYEYESMTGMLQDFNPRNFSSDNLVSLLREFFHNEKGHEEWSVTSDPMRTLSSQIVAGGVEVNVKHPEWKKGFVINNTNYVSVLTTQKYPSELTAEEFSSVFYDKMGLETRLPSGGPFFASLTIVFDNIDKRRDKVYSRLQHDLTELRKFGMRVLESKPELQDRLEEVREQIRFIELHNEVPLEAMWTMVLFNTDKDELTRSTSAMIEKFKKIGWHLTTEFFQNIAFFETLYSLPLQYHPTIKNLLERFDLLFKTNTTAIIPLIGDFRGFGYGHIPTIGRSGQLQWFDPFASLDNYNIAATGASGQGKSFTMSEVALMSLAANYKVRIIDSLPSYQKLSKLVGGQYIKFDDSDHICLNFFTHILTKKDENGEEITVRDENGIEYPVILEEDMNTIIPLIAMMSGVGMLVVSQNSENASLNDSIYSRYLAAVFEEAINYAFRSKGREAGMMEVRNYILKKEQEEIRNGNQEHANLLHSIGVGLAPFGDPGGIYFNYFNGTNNVDIQSDFTVVELSALENKGILYDIVMMTLASQIASEFFGDVSRRKLLVIDEFWKFKDNVIVGLFTEELARKVRKAGGSLVTITQDTRDYTESNPRMRALYENSSWKFRVGRSKEPTGLGTLADSLIASVRKAEGLYGEVGIYNSQTLSIGRIIVDPLSRWVYSTDPHSREKIAIAAEKYDLDEIDAVRFCAVSSEHPDKSPNDILVELGILDEKKQKEANLRIERKREQIRKAIQDAIKKGMIEIWAEPIFDKDLQIQGWEAFANIHIESESGTEKIKYSELVARAKEIDALKQLELLTIRKILDYLAVQKTFITFNVNYNHIKDSDYVNSICSMVEKRTLEGSFALEMNVRDIPDEEMPFIKRNAEMLKSFDIKLINDNFNYKKPPSLLFSLPLDYMKIDGDLLDSEDEQIIYFIESISILSSRLGQKVVITKVDSEERLKKALKVNVDLFQGQYVTKEQRLV